MKFSHVLASLYLTGMAVASPLYIITAAPDMGYALNKRAHHTTTTDDDPFDSFVSSIFEGPPTPTSPGITLPPPAIASSTESSAPTSTQDSSAPTSTDSSSSSESSAPTSTTDSSTSTTTPPPTSTSSTASSTITPPPSSTSAPVVSSTPTPAQASSDSGNGLPTAGIVVLVVFAVIIIGVIAFAIFRYNPRARAWWVARTEKKRDERTWREALDGPSAGTGGVSGVEGVSQLRQKALGDEGLGGGNVQQAEKPLPAQRKSMLQSFFTPVAAVSRPGTGQEVRRKPVQWGAPSPSSPSARQSFISEKISLAQTAAPMGRGGGEREAPPMPTPNRLSMAAHPDFGLPPMMPAADSSMQKARRGSDGVYRLD